MFRDGNNNNAGPGVDQDIALDARAKFFVVESVHPGDVSYSMAFSPIFASLICRGSTLKAALDKTFAGLGNRTLPRIHMPPNVDLKFQ